MDADLQRYLEGMEKRLREHTLTRRSVCASTLTSARMTRKLALSGRSALIRNQPACVCSRSKPLSPTSMHPPLSSLMPCNRSSSTWKPGSLIWKARRVELPEQPNLKTRTGLSWVGHLSHSVRDAYAPDLLGAPGLAGFETREVRHRSPGRPSLVPTQVSKSARPGAPTVT